MGRKKIHAIVAPVTAARKLSDRHQLDGRYSQFLQGTNPGDYGFERSFRCKCAGMNLIEDKIAERDALPIVIGPDKRVGVDNLRWAVNTKRLRARNWVGPLFFIVDDEAIKIAGRARDSRTSKCSPLRDIGYSAADDPSNFTARAARLGAQTRNWTPSRPTGVAP
jgi:hypothetical protein